MEQEPSFAGEAYSVDDEMGFHVVDLGRIAAALFIDADRIMKCPSRDAVRVRAVSAMLCFGVPTDQRRFGLSVWECHNELLAAWPERVDDSHTDTPAALSNRGWMCRRAVQRAVQMAIRQPVRSLAKRTLRASRPMAVAKLWTDTMTRISREAVDTMSADSTSTASALTT